MSQNVYSVYRRYSINENCKQTANRRRFTVRGDNFWSKRKRKSGKIFDKMEVVEIVETVLEIELPHPPPPPLPQPPPQPPAPPPEPPRRLNQEQRIFLFESIVLCENPVTGRINHAALKEK